MSERARTESIVEKKESIEFLPYFPTDLERAKTGFEKFNEVFEKSKILKKIAKKDKFFKSTISYCVMGLMPETGYFGGGGFAELDTEDERAELKKIYEEKLCLKTLHQQRFDAKEKWDHSIFNPASVEKAIKKCPITGLFPKAAEANPMKWVLENPQEWALGKDPSTPQLTARFGILSGYPPYASSVYYEYATSEESFINKKLAKRERKAYYKYANSSKEIRVFPKNLEKRFGEAIKNKEISEFQAQLLKNWFSYSGALEFFGDGFSDKDQQFFDNIKKIFKALNINYQ